MMTKPGRIPCINPRCRRTAAADKYEPNTEIICGKCFRNLPPGWKDRRRSLERRQRFIERRWVRRIMRGEAPPGSPAPTVVVVRALHEQWDEFKRYFTAPEKPVGLEGFLQEIGL